MSINNRGNSPEVHNRVVKENTHNHEHINAQHCACTAQSSQGELNYGYLSDTAAPTGITEGQTGSDWIRYYA